MTMITAYSQAGTTREAIDELVEQCGDVDAAVVLAFADAGFDVGKLTALLQDEWPEAEVMACTTAGEFTDAHTGIGGIAAMILPAAKVRRAAAELAGFRKGVDSGVQGVLRRLERNLFVQLETLDPTSCFGLVLFDGLHGNEDEVMRGFARLAPNLTFIGGSAADGLVYEQTRISVNGRETDHGAAVLIVEMDAPFAVVHTHSFTARPEPLVVTQSDGAHRIVYEVDGRPLVHAYAEALGRKESDLGLAMFMRHPLGAVADGEIRPLSGESCQPGGGIRFQAAVREGTALHVLDGGDLIGDTRRALAEAADAVGGDPAGAILFNSVLRRLLIESDGLGTDWRTLLARMPTAGFHSYGEAWHTHHNQTCTGVVFG